MLAHPLLIRIVILTTSLLEKIFNSGTLYVTLAWVYYRKSYRTTTMTIITDVHAHEILDPPGNPTIDRRCQLFYVDI